ncbi:hypothetical protein [Crocinitomix catalasitica]|uniref:hypothetical protein n=1 Tax=Crocinitomix catalasitica TaxID=184607 RepID=UPI000487EEA6|nr:hypothetical protein [Crocinitomix catalasitica]
MKKLIFASLIVLGSNLYSTAQVNAHAIGVRLESHFTSSGAEFTYQHGFGNANRLELDAGGSGGLNYINGAVTGSFHWVNNIFEGFNWFLGPAAQISFYNYSNYNGTITNNAGIAFGLGAQGGVEYDINVHGFPFIFSVDARPLFNINEPTRVFGVSGAVSARYTF